MEHIMPVTKRKFIIILTVFILFCGAISACSEKKDINYFDDPILAVKSIFGEYSNDDIVILDSAQFHTGSYLYILYNTTEDSVTKIIIGKKSENQYYIEERVPWYTIGDGNYQTKIDYAVNGVHQIDGETKKFYVWKGSYTIDDLKFILEEFEKIDVSNIKESYSNVYSVFY